MPYYTEATAVANSSDLRDSAPPVGEDWISLHSAIGVPLKDERMIGVGGEGRPKNDQALQATAWNDPVISPRSASVEDFFVARQCRSTKL